MGSGNDAIEGWRKFSEIINAVAAEDLLAPRRLRRIASTGSRPRDKLTSNARECRCATVGDATKRPGSAPSLGVASYTFPKAFMQERPNFKASSRSMALQDQTGSRVTAQSFGLWTAGQAPRPARVSK